MDSLPGFRDFYPDECAFRNYIFETWRGVARSFGFQEYDGPTIEPTELYKKKSGDELKAQLFRFIDQGGRDVYPPGPQRTARGPHTLHGSRLNPGPGTMSVVV